MDGDLPMSCPASAFKVDDLLERYSSEDGWKAVARNPSYTTSCKDHTECWSLVRTSFLINVSLEDVIAVLRPEALMDVSDGPFVCFAQVQLLRSLGAGDVLGWIKFVDKHAFCPMSWLATQTLQSGPKAGAEGCYRMVLKRDPSGRRRATLLCIPLNTKRYELMEVNGKHQVSGWVMEEEADGFTRMHRICLVSRRYRWTVPILYSASCLPPEAFEHYIQNRHRQTNEAVGFVVLRVRKCSRGPPLLPRTWPPAEGEEVEWDPSSLPDVSYNFHFAEYLRRLLPALGVRDVEVFDHLDGCRFVFYLAAMRRVDWSRVRPLVEEAMFQQRAPYRRRFGGSAAPTMEVDVEPRFCSFPDPQELDAPPEVDGSDDELWSWRQLPVRNTFIEFGPDRGDTELEETLSAP